jgi:hypothetical protein
MCAFAAGWIAHPAPNRPVTADAVALAPLPIDEQSAPPESPTAVGTTGVRSQENAPDLEKDVAAARITGILTLKVDDHGHERELQFPVIDAAGIDLRHWLTRPSGLNASAVQALERRGHKVESQRQFVTVSLKDGRNLLLPVDQVDVHFAHRVYQ